MNDASDYSKTVSFLSSCYKDVYNLSICLPIYLYVHTFGLFLQEIDILETQQQRELRYLKSVRPSCGSHYLQFKGFDPLTEG